MQSQSVWVIAEEGLNIRKVPREGEDTFLNAVPYGTELKYLRDSCVKGWAIISYEGKMRYFAGSLYWLKIDGMYIPDVYHTVLHILILAVITTGIIYVTDKKETKREAI